jgi:hypothetical protein
MNLIKTVKAYSLLLHLTGSAEWITNDVLTFMLYIVLVSKENVANVGKEMISCNFR